jgi:hypothetical protein
MACIEQNLQLRHIQAQGTFVANGATSVDVPVSGMERTSVVVYSLNTVGGTILGHPYIMTITVGTGFAVRAGASDTSTYNYIVYNQ